MKQKLRVATARIDRFCARLNSGLMAVAVVLAVTVAGTAAFRAEASLAYVPGLAQVDTLSSLGYPSAYD